MKNKLISLENYLNQPHKNALRCSLWTHVKLFHHIIS